MLQFGGIDGGRCPPAAVLAADTILIVVDVAIAAIAFVQVRVVMDFVL